MYKKFSLFIALLIISINAFAVSCPASSAFDKEGGMLWGYYWQLRASATTENWSVKNWLFHSNATTDAFPGDVPLSVRFYDDSVSCNYELPAGLFRLVSEKSPNISSIHTRTILFAAFRVSGPAGPIPHKVCHTTAGNPEVCSWEWQN